MVTRLIMADDDSESLCFVCFLLFVFITGIFFVFFCFFGCFNSCFVESTVFSALSMSFGFLFRSRLLQRVN